MRNKIGILLMCLGTALLIGALSLFFQNRAEDTRAGDTSQEILELFQAQATAPTIPADWDDGLLTDLPQVPDPFDPEMTEIEIYGYKCIGTLSIPALDLYLPVMSRWSSTLLSISPCRYTGSVKTDDLVIMAHNFQTHFGHLSELKAGDTVHFTDGDGIHYLYQVELLEELAPTDVEYMTAGDYDLTLFTCTYGGRSRVTVRCTRIREDNIT